jgi:class 3 adenylate cyclase
VLDAYWRVAAPLLTRQFGGEIEKFIGDGIVALFNSRGDQPDHAERAARAIKSRRNAIDAYVLVALPN